LNVADTARMFFGSVGQPAGQESAAKAPLDASANETLMVAMTILPFFMVFYP
jgi:hypothetical protein